MADYASLICPTGWYADCSRRTLIANTAADPRFPVIAVIHCITDHEADGHSRDEACIGRYQLAASAVGACGR